LRHPARSRFSTANRKSTPIARQDIRAETPVFAG
jgi:hypothetical protein